MRIAYVCADFGVPVFGRKGASVHVRELVAALAECGHEVRVFAPVLNEARAGTAPLSDERARFESRLASGAANGCGRVEWVAVAPEGRHAAWLDELRRAEDLLGQPTRLRQELRNLLYNLPLHARLVQALAAGAPDFVYERYALFGVAGLEAARTLGVPHLLEVNAPLAEEQERMRGLEMKELARAAERRILRSTDAAIVVSRRLGEFVASCDVPRERIHVLPNAVDPRRFAPGAAGEGAASALGERLRGRCVIGFVGSLKPWHGVETLIEAFHALAARRPAVHLLIVGEGPGMGELEGSIRERHLESQVTFAGAVAHEDVPGWLALMDIAAAPYTPHENFYFSPLKLFEYMAMGIPVVAGRIGQVAELFSDGENGVLHEPGDAGALAAALERLAGDPELRRRIGQAGRRGVGEERTWRHNAQRIVAIATGLPVAGEPAPAAGESRA